MVGPSRRKAVSHSFNTSSTLQSYFTAGEKYYCHCGMEAVVLETEDNYRRRFAACPRENENACTYLMVIDPDYPKQACDVIDELAEEVRSAWDTIRLERNEHQFMQQQDGALDLSIAQHLRMWKARFIMSALVNVVLIFCMIWSFGR